MSQITFTIVTVTRNAAAHLAPCLQSVARQTYAGVEHLVVDGASTDSTRQVFEAHKGPGGRFVSEPDSGIYDAMNKGVRLATGDYVLFLGADDYLADDNVLRDAAAFLEREGRPDWIYGDLQVRQPGRPPTVFSPPEPAEALDFLICGCLPHQSTLARRDLFSGKVGAFDTRYRVHGDYDWFLRAMVADGVRVLHFKRVIGSFFLGGVSSLLETGQREVYAIQNGFDVYRRPEWVERRLIAFQEQWLAARVALQNSQLSGADRLVQKVRRLKRFAIKSVDSLARTPRNG